MLGDVTGEYDYNTLLYQQDLSPLALYGKDLLIGIGVIVVAYLLWPKGRRHRQ